MRARKSPSIRSRPRPISAGAPTEPFDQVSPHPGDARLGDYAGAFDGVEDFAEEAAAERFGAGFLSDAGCARFAAHLLRTGQVFTLRLGYDLHVFWRAYAHGGLLSPDPALFELTRDKRLVNAMLADIGGETLAASMLTETAKVQKTAISNRIIGERCALNPDWRPAFMAAPPRRYVEGAASASADAWARTADLFRPKSAETNATPNLQDAA